MGNLYQAAEKALGKNATNIEARNHLRALKAGKGEITLRYEWIEDWSALDGVEFSDGQEWITFGSGKQ